MERQEHRVVIEDLQLYPQTLRNTSVRRGDVSAWVSTVTILPRGSYGFIETATFRTKGIKAVGREGQAVPEDPKRLIPLMPFSNQFGLSQSDEALEFHADVVDRIATLLEDDSSLLEVIERQQLED